MSEINEQSCGWCDITVSPDSVYFEVVEDWKFIPSGKYVRLERDGSGMSPRWSAVGSEEWIRITPSSGDVPKRVRIDAYSIGMPVGVYEGYVTITSSVDVKIEPSVIKVVLNIFEKPKDEPDEPLPPPPPPPDDEPDIPDEPEEPKPPPDEPDVPPKEPEEPPPDKEKCWLCGFLEEISKWFR